MSVVLERVFGVTITNSEGRKIAIRDTGVRLFKAHMEELFTATPELHSFQWEITSDYNGCWYALEVQITQVNEGEVYGYITRDLNRPVYFNYTPKGYEHSELWRDPKLRQNARREHAENYVAGEAVFNCFRELLTAYGRSFFRMSFGAASVNWVTREENHQVGYVPGDTEIEEFAREKGLI